MTRERIAGTSVRLAAKAAIWCSRRPQTAHEKTTTSFPHAASSTSATSSSWRRTNASRVRRCQSSLKRLLPMDSICTSVCIQRLCMWWLLFPVSDQPICGNQIVEEGELCDVGHNDSDACCYSATHPVGVQCRLKPGKVCRCHTQDMSVCRCWGLLKQPFLISSFVLWSKSQSGSVLQARLWVPACRPDLRRGDRLSKKECVSRLLPWLPWP